MSFSLPRIVRLTASSLALMALAAPAFGADDVAATDRLVRQWLNTERQIGALKADWQTQKPVLEQRLSLLEAEKAQLQKILEENRTGQGDVEARRAKLLVEQTSMEQEARAVETAVSGVRAQIRTLSAQLPPPLQTQWAKEQAALSDEAATSDQLQALLAQLSALMDFDRRISLNEATHEGPNGTPVRVKELYLGLGTAWFASSDGTYAGTGEAGPDGWRWQFRDDIDTDQILKAIAIYEKQAEADFVALPVSLTVQGGAR